MDYNLKSKRLADKLVENLSSLRLEKPTRNFLLGKKTGEETILWPCSSHFFRGISLNHVSFKSTDCFVTLNFIICEPQHMGSSKKHNVAYE